MSHIVYCWEMGKGLASLARISAEMAAQGHRVTCVVSDITRAAQLFDHSGVKWLPAPKLPPVPRAPSLSPSQSPSLSPYQPMNHADILRVYGFSAPSNLYPLISAWRTVFELLRPDRVVCESAPTAALAADTLDLPVVCVDNGFSMPPLSDPLPALRDAETVETRVLRASEQRTLGVINDVLGQLRRAPLDRFTDVFDRQTWYRNWVEFNHFGVHSPERHAGQIFKDTPGVSPQWPKGDGRRIFAYLKPGHVHSIKVLEEAAALGYRVLAHIPGFPADAYSMLRMTGRVTISDMPVCLAELDEEVEMGIWHGPTEAAVRCLSKGMRMLFLPTTIEQRWACLAMKRRGLPLHIAAGDENWRQVFETIQSWPRPRIDKKFEPADVPLLARRLVAG